MYDLGSGSLLIIGGCASPLAGGRAALSPVDRSHFRNRNSKTKNWTLRTREAAQLHHHLTQLPTTHFSAF